LIEGILRKYPKQVRVVLKHAPLQSHSEALLGHEAILAAGAQGKFWEMYRQIVANQQAITREVLIKYSDQLGLDSRKVRADLETGLYAAVVNADLADANRRGIRGTPVFFVNTHRIDGIQPLGDFVTVIETEIESKAASKASTK
jgi:predicted DsbA family dithiol-disulfide isomerase